MKKSLIALAAVAAVGAASAQSSVTVSGNLVLSAGTTKVDTTSTGAQLIRNTGNIAFKGTEDLGGGLKAGFELQTTIGTAAGTALNVAGTTTAAGTPTTPTLIGDRGAYLTLQSATLGTVQAGRANAAVRSMMAIGDVSRISIPSTTGVSAGNSSSSTDAKGGDANAYSIYGDAYSNYVSYTTPSISGFSATVALVPVDGKTAATKDTMSYTVGYAAGPLAVAYNMTDSKQTQAGQAISQGSGITADKLYVAAAGAYKLSTLAASYDLGVAKIGAMYQTVDLATGVNPGAGTLVTVNVPFGATSVGVGYGQRANKAVTDLQFGDGVKQTFVGIRHDLSKRTHVQGVLSKTDRQGTATDTTQTLVTIGHSF